MCWSGGGSEVRSPRPRTGTPNGSFHDRRARRAQVQNTSVAFLKQQENVLLPQFKQNYQQRFSFFNRARFLIYILINQLFARKYTLKHSLVKIISTPIRFGLIRPSSGSCRAWLLSYLEQFTFVLRWLCSSMHLESGYVPLPLLTCIRYANKLHSDSTKPFHATDTSTTEGAHNLILNACCYISNEVQK